MGKIQNLKPYLLWLFNLFTIIPIVVLSIVILYNLYTAKLYAISHKQTTILKYVKNDTDEILSHIEFVARFIKQRYPKNKHKILDGLINTQENISSIVILNSKGVVKNMITKNISSNIFVGFDCSKQNYFTSIKNGKQNYWSKVYFSHTLNAPAISYSIKVDNDTIAVLEVNLQILDKFTKRFKSIDGSYMVRIVDQDGYFLAHPDNPLFVAQRKTIVNSPVYKKYISKGYKYTQMRFNGIAKANIIGVYASSNKTGWNIIVVENFDTLFKPFTNMVIFTLLFAFILIIIAIYFSNRFSSQILGSLNKIDKQIDKIAHGENINKIDLSKFHEFNQLSKNVIIMQDKITQREKQIKQEEEKNKQQELQLIESSKMAQMGEMIGNIAHQWRQPLSIISTSASGMKIEKEYALLTDEKFIDYCDGIIEHTQYLSDTIDTFRDFIKEKKEKKEVILQDRIDTALAIIKASIQNNHIKLINEIDYANKIKITMVVGELSQVIINIVNNAKDILVEKKIDDPYIKIGCIIKENMAIITIEDNGGGIPENILPKIFNPYFTTKHKSQGTGLGLYMSKKIITQSLQGTIQVQNNKLGAVFTITFPINKF